MKLHFDSSQQYQLDAIKAVTDLFEGQPLPSGDFETSLSYGSLAYSENGFGNKLLLNNEQIWENTRIIQQRNEINNAAGTFQGMHFSVEMETGTGKTYVYLRTIYELSKLYGFKKFVIVVPSVAIREGVFKNLQITSDHFQNLYDKTPVNFTVYDSKAVPALRGFASANTIQILVINIDAFAKDENIINKPNDRLSGKKPIEFLQSCNPIVIVDEPQNMEGGIRKKAIDNLNPLCTLRYSATHKNAYNLLYSLNPVKAYNLGLVKQIEVDSVLSENSMNQAFIELESIHSTKTKITAKIKIDCNTEKGAVKKSVTIKVGDDIYDHSNQREMYKNGFIVTGIDPGNNTIELGNNLVLSVGESQGGMHDELMRYMIKKTVEEHLQKEKRFKGRGIKVLSLFFIDRVKNYREYDEQGNMIKGKFAEWFEEIYQEEIKKAGIENTITHPVSEVHNGYFSQDSKGRIKDTGGETIADDDTYKLIMQEKEKLLDAKTPLRFIFSHSALREGWDNPNVFQICTLNETRSTIRKRQEIGRGLRLPVNQDGERIFDKTINRLTVIANESYDDFAKALQKEIEEECDVIFTGIRDKNKKQKVTLRKGFEMDPKFLQIWERIKFRSRYSVNYNTSKLIESASEAVKDKLRMPEITKPAIRSVRKEILLTDDGVAGGKILGESLDRTYSLEFELPDILSYIQNKTELTRATILEILKKSNRLPEFFVNPQSFMDNIVAVIKAELYKLMIDGIRYEKIGTTVYEMSLFDTDFEIYYNKDNFKVSDPGKTIYENIIPLDSGVENTFAGDCESNIHVEFYFKLPSGFKINTPIGTYNPDWAVVFENEKKVYFIVETKSAGQELLNSEQMKIKCGTAYFKGLEGVSYIRASSVSELL